MKTSEQTHKRLVRPEQGRMIAGVCAAFADYFNVDPTWIRIGYAFLTIITHVAPLLILYAALIFIIPKASENSTSI
ncbi:PspC domain-containing protein [bacterium]|nr:PspC domain-containing protein [bacterium]